MARYLTEFIGTFFLVLAMGLTELSGAPLAPLAIGAMLLAVVYMGAPVSGAHYNPAVSLALLLRGKLDTAEFVPYVLAQVSGAFVAALVVKLLLGRSFAPAPGDGVGSFSALLVEVLFTFALALVVLSVAASDRTRGNSYYGLAIGCTVVAAMLAGAPVSGGAFNPAVGIGPTLVHGLTGGGSWSHLWLYLLGPFVGGAIAAMVFGMQEGEGER